MFRRPPGLVKHLCLAGFYSALTCSVAAQTLPTAGAAQSALQRWQKSEKVLEAGSKALTVVGKGTGYVLAYHQFEETAATDPIKASAHAVIDYAGGAFAGGIFTGVLAVTGTAFCTTNIVGLIACGGAAYAFEEETTNLLKDFFDRTREKIAETLPSSAPHLTKPPARCLPWSATVTLTGNVTIQTFPGPPNFESVANGDRPIRAPVLALPTPTCVGTGDDPDRLPITKEVAAIQIRTSGQVPPGPVTLTGKLGLRETGYDFTKVILWLPDDGSVSTAENEPVPELEPTPTVPSAPAVADTGAAEFPDLSSADAAKQFLRKVMPANAYCDQLDRVSYYCRMAERPNSDINSVNVTVNTQLPAVVLIAQFLNGRPNENYVGAMYRAAREMGISTSFVLGCYNQSRAGMVLGRMDVGCESFSVMGTTHIMLQIKESTRF